MKILKRLAVLPVSVYLWLVDCLPGFTLSPRQLFAGFCIWLTLSGCEGFAQTHTEMTLEDAQANVTGTKGLKSVNAVQHVSVGNPQGWAGVDVGAWINSAFASSACNNACTVYVDQGSYSFSTTISYPTLHLGTAALIMDAGAILTYTAGGDAIAVIPTTVNNASQSTVIIRGGQLLCASPICGGNGIHAKILNMLEISNIYIHGFTNGLLFEGVNTCDVHDSDFDGNSVGILVTDTAYLGGSPVNACTFRDNQLNNNATWAIKETKSGSCGGCTQHLNNIYSENVMEANTTGGIWLDDSAASVIEKNYFDLEPHYIQIGDASNNDKGIQIITNIFITRNVGQASIEIANGNNTAIAGNIEISAGTTPTNFISITTESNTVVWIDRQIVSTNVLSGDPNNDIMVYGSTAYMNGWTNSSTGFQFRNIAVTNGFTTGAASRASIAAGVISVPNNVSYSAADAANTTQVPMVKLDAANAVILDPGGQGLKVGNTGVGTLQAGVSTLTEIKSVNRLITNTAPTISSGFGTSPSIATNNGTASFSINVGTGGAASTGVIGLPAATNGWNCTCEDITTNSATVFKCKQTGAGTTTTAPIGEFTAAGAAQAWAASDIVIASCFAR